MKEVLLVFESLGNKLQDTFKKISGQSKITESNISDALREVRLALLEADVNYGVVKSLVSRIKEKAEGQEVIRGVNPKQQFIKIINDELIEILGGSNTLLNKSIHKPTIIMLVGLQGAGN